MMELSIPFEHYESLRPALKNKVVAYFVKQTLETQMKLKERGKLYMDGNQIRIMLDKKECGII